MDKLMEGACVSYRSPEENMVSEEFLKFMFGLVKKSRISLKNPDNPHISIMIAKKMLTIGSWGGC